MPLRLRVDDRIMRGKLKAWDTLQTRLARSGLNLPALDTNGYFYLPNRYLSVRRKVAIDASFAAIGEQIRRAFTEILAGADFPGRPVMDIFGWLDGIESAAFPAEATNAVLKRAAQTS